MRRLIITLLILIGVFVAADFVAAAVAESAVSRQMREQIGLVDDPSVRINGFPFLTQAVSGQYDSVDIAAQRIRFDELRDLEVRVQLRDVTAPLSELMGSGPRTLLAQEAEGAVRVGPRDLERLLPGVDKLRIESIDTESLERAVATGGEASLAAIDPDTAARLVGTTEVLGQQLEVSVIAVLELVDGRAQIVPRDVRLGDADSSPLPSAAQRALRVLFTLRVDPGSLPLSVTPTTLQANDGTLEISGIATDLVLGGAAPSGR
ncbi:MAG: LmeA family phospholipid-binding protein [Pseudonocardia sp.]